MAGTLFLYAVLLIGGAVCGALVVWRMRHYLERLSGNAVFAASATDSPDIPVRCPICSDYCAALDVVDFNKSCEEVRGKFLELSGIPIYYYRCNGCQFCFAPEIARWGTLEFAERIYNEDYMLVDPDYQDTRPRGNAKSLISTFGEQGRSIRHLDYGGGAGLLSQLLNEAGWNSVSYDPFANRDVDAGTLGQFDLITAYEVFEHVPDVNELMARLSALLAPEGVVLFSTLLSDGNIVPGQRLTWWYASPRNGHISLYSKKSLGLLGAQQGFNFASFSEVFHMYGKQVPDWAKHLIHETRRLV